MVENLFDVDGEGVVVLRLHVQPGAGRTAVVGRHGDSLKVRVAAPPQGGRANDACSALLAEVLGVAPSDIVMTSGAGSRTKRVRVTGLDPDDARRRLAAALELAAGPGGPPGGSARPPAGGGRGRP